MMDAWLLKQADQVIEEWNALDKAEETKTKIIFMIGRSFSYYFQTFHTRVTFKY